MCATFFFSSSVKSVSIADPLLSVFISFCLTLPASAFSSLICVFNFFSMAGDGSFRDFDICVSDFDFVSPFFDI